jgi:hypothetical protein
MGKIRNAYRSLLENVDRSNHLGVSGTDGRILKHLKNRI